MNGDRDYFEVRLTKGVVVEYGGSQCTDGDLLFITNNWPRGRGRWRVKLVSVGGQR